MRDSFSNLIRYIGKGIPNNSRQLFDQLNTLLKDYPSLIQFNENYIKLSVDLLFKPLYKFDIPTHFNAATEFYAELIKLESIRILNNVIAAVDESDNSIDKHFRANTAWKNIRYVADIASKELSERGLTDMPQYKFTSTLSPNEISTLNTHYVLYLLKQYNTRLFFEIQILFKDHLKTIETHDQFYLHTLKESIPVTAPLTFTPHYYQIRAKKIIANKSYTEEAVAQLLEEVNNTFAQPTGDTINIIGALENYIFVNQFNIKSKNGDFETLAAPSKSTALYKQINKSISNQLKKKVYGHQRLEIIQNKLEELSNLNISSQINIPTQKLSAPRKLTDWLEKQENIYKENLSTTFSPEPDPAEELKQDSKPLSKKDKPNLDDSKTKANEMLKFMSGFNINKEKIMTEPEYDRMIIYTFHLIENEEVPNGIIKISQIGLSNITIRYTYYLIHRALYGTKRIKDNWIDFLHSVFKQFEDAQTSTTKTKFSLKPSLYDSDMKKMLG